MDFRLLGPLEVSEQNRSVALGGLKQRSLLAVLLLHANEIVATDRLIADLWGETPPAIWPARSPGGGGASPAGPGRGGRPTSCAPGSRSGAARRSPTSPTSRSR